VVTRIEFELILYKETNKGRDMGPIAQRKPALENRIENLERLISVLLRTEKGLYFNEKDLFSGPSIEEVVQLAISNSMSRQELISDVFLMKERLSKLSIQTHNWLSLVSLGIDVSDTSIHRFAPMRLYLSDATDQTIKNVSEAINLLLDAFDFHIADDLGATRGSWYRRLFVSTKRAVTQTEFLERLQQVERALQIKHLEMPQAGVDEKQVASIKLLLDAIKEVPNVAMQIGSILLIKTTSDDGPLIQVRTLTSKELIHLESNQSLLSSPAQLLKKLARASKHSANQQSPGGERTVTNLEGNLIQTGLAISRKT
jgi:hypothetical protein